MKKIRFSKTAIDALPLPPEGKRETYYDEKTPGLQLRVSASGVRSFSFYRRVKGGRPVRVTIGKFPSTSVEAAQRTAARINLDFAEMKGPAQLRRTAHGGPTFGALFEAYIERHSRPQKRTWREDLSKQLALLAAQLAAIRTLRKK
jgi:Arm DNA-binding domain